MAEENESPPQILVAVLVLVGALCVVSGGWRLYHGWRSSSWESAPGRTLTAQVEVVEGPEHTRSRARLSCQYTVAGKRYHGERISFAAAWWTSIFSPEKRARETAAAHSPGRELTVYHDPDEPWEAALIAGVSAAAFAQPVFGGALLLGAFLFSRRNKAEQLQVPAACTDGIRTVIPTEGGLRIRSKAHNDSAGKPDSLGGAVGIGVRVDPLFCPRCGWTMRIIAFLTVPRVIGKILRHLAAKGVDARSPPVASPLDVLADVGHAQWVFSMPKMLRPYFLYHQPLLGRL
jgi:hypothetical protein